MRDALVSLAILTWLAGAAGLHRYLLRRLTPAESEER